MESTQHNQAMALLCQETAVAAGADALCALMPELLSTGGVTTGRSAAVQTVLGHRELGTFTVRTETMSRTMYVTIQWRCGRAMASGTDIVPAIAVKRLFADIERNHAIAEAALENYVVALHMLTPAIRKVRKPGWQEGP
jgi:hypothetical protein